MLIPPSPPSPQCSSPVFSSPLPVSQLRNPRVETILRRGEIKENDGGGEFD
jgi:hypothetical protein